MPIYYSIQVTKILGDCSACADSEYQAAFGGLESRLAYTVLCHNTSLKGKKVEP